MKLSYAATSALARSGRVAPPDSSDRAVFCPCRSIVPEILKALGSQFGIPDGMLDVPMAEILLERSRVDPFIG